MPMFPDAWMGELLAKNDIVELVSQYVQLKPRGGRMWGCCPFHNEKTPSFSVTRDKQFYYCFGCHAGGTAVQFVMEMEKLPFVEAVKFLANRAGMELPGEVDDERLRRERALRERIYAANKEAARYYYDTLMGPAGKAGRAYLLRRGMDGKTVRRFGLGYAPGGGEALYAFLKDKGYAPGDLVEAGLVRKRDNREEYYDFFRDRIIFPIIDAGGRVLGFGARTMGEDTPKYLNTGDTAAYNKRNHLYGLNLLKRRQLTDVVMVEGYMDVISLAKGGIDNAVAGLGTAFTQAQARLLKRYVPTVYLCYDGDSAGQNAALRSLDILSAEGLEVRVIVVPGGQDPDDFVREHGKEAFLDLKGRAMPRNAFKLETMAARFDLETPDGREAFAKQSCAFVGALQPVEVERYAPVIARKTGLSLETVRAQCGLAGGAQENSVSSYRHTKTRESGKNDGPDRTEQTLLACMLHSPQLAASVSADMAEAGICFSPQALELSDRLLAASTAPDGPDIALLMAELPPESAELAAAAQAQKIAEPRKTAADCILWLRREAILKTRAALQARSLLPEDPDFKAVQLEMDRLSRELEELKKLGYKTTKEG